MAKYALLRMRAGTPEPEPVTEVNIIPVIDISLVLLVILFVTAPLLSVPNMPVSLPRSSAPQSEEATIAITYTEDGAMNLRAAPTDWEKLPRDLLRERQRLPTATVILRVDKAVPYRIVQRLIAATKKAGAPKIALGTEPFK